MKRPIFLIGYMACGKTTLGRALAAALQAEFVDLDQAIETRCGMSVSEIFATKGEAEFRRMESEAVVSMAAPCERLRIVACGGGTPCQGTNLDTMLRTGLVVWLKASRTATLRRIRQAGDTRPLLSGKDDVELAEFVAANLAARRPVYARAHARFESSYLENQQEIDQSVERFISRFGLTSNI